jgi:hypothetical protein
MLADLMRMLKSVTGITTLFSYVFNHAGLSATYFDTNNASSAESATGYLFPATGPSTYPSWIYKTAWNKSTETTYKIRFKVGVSFSSAGIPVSFAASTASTASEFTNVGEMVRLSVSSANLATVQLLGISNTSYTITIGTYYRCILNLSATTVRMRLMSDNEVTTYIDSGVQSISGLTTQPSAGYCNIGGWINSGGSGNTNYTNIDVTTP